MKEEQWIVGAEYDDVAFVALGTSLRTLGYTLDTKSWGMGGSQEISTWLIRGPKGKLKIEAETYISLSVSGAADLVHEVRQHFSSLQPANKSLNTDAPKDGAPVS